MAVYSLAVEAVKKTTLKTVNLHVGVQIAEKIRLQGGSPLRVS